MGEGWELGDRGNFWGFIVGGVRVWGLGFRLWGVGVEVWGSGFAARDLGLKE